MSGEQDAIDQVLVEPTNIKTKEKKAKEAEDPAATSKTDRWLRITFLVINGITFTIGFILLIVGCVYYANHESYRDMWHIGSSFCSASVFCIVVGVIVCLVSVLGFFGALRSNYCCLLAFCILMSITVFLEMILSVTFFAAISNDNLGSLVQKLMKESMNNFDDRHKDHGVTKAWNLLQTELECCGVITADDWHKDVSSVLKWASSNALPESCCEGLAYLAYDDPSNATTTNDRNRSNNNNNCKLGSEDHYTVGCYAKLRETIQANGGAIGGVIIVFVVAQIALIVTAFHLKKKIAATPKRCPPFY